MYIYLFTVAASVNFTGESRGLFEATRYIYFDLLILRFYRFLCVLSSLKLENICQNL
jgi:hypothetical protein